MTNHRTTATGISLVLAAATLGCVRPSALRAQSGACEQGTSIHAEQVIAGLKALAARSDSVGLKIRETYEMPIDLSPAEVVVVSAPTVCAQAASLYFQDRDGAGSVSAPVLVVQMRNRFYVQESRVHTRAGSSAGHVYGLLADSTFSAALRHYISR
jgi:hypothetical protein